MIEEKYRRLIELIIGFIVLSAGTYKITFYLSAFFMLFQSLVMIVLVSIGIIVVLNALALIKSIHYRKIIAILLILFIVSSSVLLSSSYLIPHKKPKIIVYFDLDEIQYDGVFTDKLSATSSTYWMHYLTRVGVLIPPLTYHSPYGSSLPDAYMMVTARTAMATRNNPIVWNYPQKTILDAAYEKGFHIFVGMDYNAMEMGWLKWYSGSNIIEEIFNAGKKGLFNQTISEAEKFILKHLDGKVFVTIWWFELDEEENTEESGTRSKGWIDSVTRMDKAIGKLINFLKENNFWNDTLLAITGDEGINDGPFMYMYGPFTKYDVFLLLYGPGVKRGVTINFGWYTHADAVATIAYLADLNMGLIDGIPIYSALEAPVEYPYYVTFALLVITAIILPIAALLSIRDAISELKKRKRMKEE